MNWRIGLLLYLLGFIVYSIPAVYQKSPGYMDADYYYSVGLSLKEGLGFKEMLLWNYLDDPEGLPHPSNAYWMPLPAILAWLGMKLTSSTEFVQSRIIFLAVAALVPPLTATLAFRLTRKKSSAWLAGLLAIFPGFYLPYLGTSDAFSICMVLGAASLILMDLIMTREITHQRIWYCFFLGILAGLLYLTRIDGFIWLVCGLGFIVWTGLGSGLRVSKSFYFLGVGACLAGYLLVVAPWFVRNINAFGTPFPPGGSRVLWISTYNQIFTYPADSLTFSSWLESGMKAIVSDRAWSFGQNLQTAVAIHGGVFLLPLVILGIYQYRRNPLIWTGLAGWAVTLVIMTIAFPYAGARGGFFHSGAAWQPLWWAIIPSGLDYLLDWVTRKRSWPPLQARRVFYSAVPLLTLLLTFLVSYPRVIGSEMRRPGWDQSYIRYLAVEQMLSRLGTQPGDIVLVNNAPGYYVATRRPAISIPYGELGLVLEVAQKYKGKYLVLELDQIPGSPELFHDPADSQGLQYLGSVSNTRIYSIEN